MLEWTRYRQEFAQRALPDPAGALREALAQADWPANLHGRAVALAVGSRGIGHLVELVREVIAAIRERRGEPFIVPAMGSHGASTAAGQTAVLARLGVAAETLGVPVRSTLETVVVGQTPSGWPVHLDAAAAQADHLVLLNRIKPHTSFSGRFESGLLKLLAVGLGNQAGAATVHHRGFAQAGEVLEEVGRTALAHVPLLLGIGVVEDAYHAPALIEALPPAAILRREPELLATAREWLPRLPFDDLDLLVVEQLGKDVSGTGLDPNVIGRRGIPGLPDLPTPRIAVIVALDLTEATGGNGLGVGLADICTQRLVDRLDRAAMYANALTVGVVSRVKIPLTCADEGAALAAALRLLRQREPAAVRGVRIKNTRDLDELWLTPALAAEAAQKGLHRDEA